MINYFTWTVAIRHLRYGVGQSLLTVGVVAISVLLIVYLRTIIGGTQVRLVRNTTGAIPHITMEPPERTPLGAWLLPGFRDDSKVLYVGETVNLPKAQVKIEDWRQWIPYLDHADPAITAVSPTVSGQAFLFRGARRQSVKLNGVVPERHNNIVNIEGNLLEGRFLKLTSGELALGVKLAYDYGLKLRDKVRLVGPGKVSMNFTVAGIYETGFGQVDDGTVFVNLRDGQSLLELGGAISSFGIKLDDIYLAEDLAQRFATRVPFKVKSWISENPNLFFVLASQSQTSDLILIMTTLAAGFGIASILVMSVTGKFREIGILKAMGAIPREIQAIFLIEGFMLAVVGCLVGVPLGIAILKGLASIRTTSIGGKSQAALLIEISPQLLLGASTVAVVTGMIAAYFPARRAGGVDPMQVIRGT